jgi:hypothetical protein
LNTGVAVEGTEAKPEEVREAFADAMADPAMVAEALGSAGGSVEKVLYSGWVIQLLKKTPDDEERSRGRREKRRRADEDSDYSESSESDYDKEEADLSSSSSDEEDDEGEDEEKRVKRELKGYRKVPRLMVVQASRVSLLLQLGSRPRRGTPKAFVLQSSHKVGELGEINQDEVSMVELHFDGGELAGDCFG